MARASPGEVLSGSRAAKTDEIPSQVHSVFREHDAGGHRSVRSPKQDRLLWKVLAHSAGTDVNRDPLLGSGMIAAIELRCSGRRQDGPRTLADIASDIEQVRAGNSTWGMQQVDMGRSIGFRMKGSLNSQRTDMTPPHEPRQASGKFKSEV